VYAKAFPAVLSTLFVGSLFALPTIKADDPPPVTRKDLKASQDNLKRIALAFHGHADVNNHQLPSDIVDKDGKPLLSWRVAILPFVDEKPLYMQFKLDEPWDSGNNMKLIEKMPKLYAPVRVKAKAGETLYQVFVGKDALFGPNKRPIVPGSIPDGMQVTGMVFEAGDPVTWSKPADLPFNVKWPLPKLGGLFEGECQVAMCDGSVIHLKKNPDELSMKNFIMPADGNVVDLDKLRK
jgi:hypothetical protein